MAYKNKISLFLMLIFMILPILSCQNNVLAETTGSTNKTYTLLEPLPCIQNYDSKGVAVPPICPAGTGEISMITEVDLGNFFVYAFNLLIALSAVAAVFMIVWGGFQYVTTDSWQDKKDGREKFFNAIIGLIMVLVAYLVLRTVNPKLVNIPSSIPEIKVPNSLTQSPLDLFEKLNVEANKYNLSGNQAVISAQQSKQKVESLQQEISQLRNQLGELIYDQGLDETDTAVIDLRNKIAQKNSEVVGLQSSAIVDVTKSIIQNGGIAQTLNNINSQILNGNITTESIDEKVKSCIEFINKTRDTRNSDLAAMGAYDKITGSGGLNDIANASELDIELIGIKTKLDGMEIKTGGQTSNGQFISVYGTTARSNNGNPITPNAMKTNLSSDLNSVRNSLENIKDPQLKQGLQTKISEIQELFDRKLGK